MKDIFGSMFAPCELINIFISIIDIFRNALLLTKIKPQRFSLPSIILTDPLGNKTLLQRVQKFMVCDLLLVDFDPFCVLPCFQVRCF